MQHFYNNLKLFREAKYKKEQEQQSGDREEYEKFFQATLKKFGAESPQDLDKEKRKEFFDYVNKNWDAQDESIKENYEDEYLSMKPDPMTNKIPDADALNKYGQRAKDRHIKRWHDAMTKVYNRPDEENQDGSEYIEQSPKRHADKDLGESLESIVDRYLK